MAYNIKRMTNVLGATRLTEVLHRAEQASTLERKHQITTTSEKSGLVLLPASEPEFRNSLGKAPPGLRGRSPKRGVASATPDSEACILLSRGTQIPEYLLQGCLAAFKSRNPQELFVLKSRTETDARKEDRVIFVLISRTNFSRNFVRVLCATVRDFSAVTTQLNPGKGLKTNKRISGI